MRSETDRAFEDSFQLGRRNAEIIELARRHCLNLEFHQSGGQGLAEAISGLPINMRRVHCRFGKPGGGMAMNLEWIATDFYEANCVGCPDRRPTGQLPNLSTVIEERKSREAQAERTAAAESAARQHAWKLRSELRRALAAEATQAMASALDDIEKVDSDPTEEHDAEKARVAIRRLEVITDRAPELFTDEVVNHVILLVADSGLTSLVGPLRRLALEVSDYRDRVLELAVEVLDRGPLIEAGRCIADLHDSLNRDALTDTVVESLVFLAGRPERDDFGQRRPQPANNDPAGLLVAAEKAPEKTSSVIRRMLSAERRPAATLELPIGVDVRRDADDIPGDFERCAAAGAIRMLLPTHPDLGASLTSALVANLRVDEDDRYGLHPISDLQRTLAHLLVIRAPQVVPSLVDAARSTSEEMRDRLFGVLERARHLVDPNNRWREPNDPKLDGHERSACLEDLTTLCFERLSGDWGHEVAFKAAALLEDLAGDAPQEMVVHIPALLGAFLVCLDELEAGPPIPALTGPPNHPQLAAMEAASYQFGTAAKAGRLLDALEHIAKIDCSAVVAAIIDALSAVTGTLREVEASWRFLPLLGKVGRTHGAEPGILRLILPTLHTYLVHSDQSVRANAITAWTEIGSKHELPSSLSDLLPAHTKDPYVVVINAMLQGARRLRWSDADRLRLVTYAFTVASGACSDETLKQALLTLLRLTRDDENLRPRTEEFVLKSAVALRSYDLRDVIRGTWLPKSFRSGSMAKLRLAQARDPRVNDRWNAGDDEELTALLSCGEGLAEITTAEFVEAALELSIEYPLQGAEFAEVAWRAGRPQDAMRVLSSIRDTLPDQPVYSDRISFVDSLIAGLNLDVRPTDVPPPELLEAAKDAAVWLALSAERADDHRARVAGQLSARISALALMEGLALPLGLPARFSDNAFDPDHINNELGASDPAKALKARADALQGAGRALDRNAQRLTPTAAFVRAFAGLCVVAAHLLHFSAAELDARVEDAEAHRVAARRRAADLAVSLQAEFGDDDPLAGPVLEALRQVQAGMHGEEVADKLRAWSRFTVPLQIVDGPRARSKRRDAAATTASSVEESQVLVSLATIDGLLVAGPQVLKPSQIYTLRLEVRGDNWPVWADRLDAELLSHMTQVEAQTPAFTWPRPAGLDSESTFAVAGEGTLVLRFGLAAGQPAPPFLVSLRFRGTKDGGPLQHRCDVAGHTQLRLRPFDASRDALTKYRMVDERLIRLYERLHGAGYDEDHVQAFCRLLTATCRATLAMTWEQRYRKGQRVTEREFHDDLFLRLQSDPELEGRIERGSPLALGFLDVRHDGITSELKVERKSPVTRENITKYIGQPTQYAAADGARLSILCVLDMSPKTNPVATAENYLWQLGPVHHGLTNPEAPSLVAALVVNAAMPTPSSWSRRRITPRPESSGNG